MCCPIKEVKLPPNTEYKPDSFDEVTKVVRAKVAISYSHDSEEHKKWVKKLADDLENNGIKGQGLNEVAYAHSGRSPRARGPVVPGSARRNAQRVLCILTPNYNNKTDKKGGVGTEHRLMRNEIVLREDISKNKYIPILREGTKETSCPAILIGKKYQDFRNDDDYDKNLKALVADILYKTDKDIS